jgi:hypothetical protein
VDPIAAAREEGLAQGFDIGIRANLAERGVVPLVPRSRKP